jgi:hypothetical protein
LKHLLSLRKSSEFMFLGPPLWSCGLEFLATDPEVRVRFPSLPDFLRSLERGPLSLVSTIEELLARSSGSGLEN